MCTDDVSEWDRSAESRNVSAPYIICRKSRQFTLQFILSTELRWSQSVAQVTLSTVDLLMKILSQNEQKVTLKDGYCFQDFEQIYTLDCTGFKVGGWVGGWGGGGGPPQYSFCSEVHARS